MSLSSKCLHLWSINHNYQIIIRLLRTYRNRLSKNLWWDLLFRHRELSWNYKVFLSVICLVLGHNHMSHIYNKQCKGTDSAKGWILHFLLVSTPAPDLIAAFTACEQKKDSVNWKLMVMRAGRMRVHNSNDVNETHKPVAGAKGLRG